MGINEFIDNLKRDKARGELAPHQIILLISLYNLSIENNSKTLNIEDLISTFNKVWKENQDKFKTKNCNLGMPLKVFVNREYLEINIKEDIVDFRSKTELISKITEIRICLRLLNFFNNTELEDYLETRILK
ncbi:hypothetical protein [Polaribacter sp. IC063]|uniref:hypothetical protein n=1 Tax=Polaribacter sp. IC063 TaxID=57031 RepID=UPI0011BE9265|nr:hypothetical protein [Polaribacter sp. IC063]TXD53924.1 hypothetical protein ES043_02535 [Polaribacter sp. IC063]